MYSVYVIINFMVLSTRGDAIMVAKENVRTSLTINRETKEQLTKLAKKDGRSFNNLVIAIINDYLLENT